MKEEAFSVIQGLDSCWQRAVPDGPLSSWPVVPCCSWRAEVRGPAGSGRGGPATYYFKLFPTALSAGLL